MFILYKYILSSTYLKGNHEKIVDLTVLSNKEKAQLLRHNLNRTSKPNATKMAGQALQCLW